MNCEEFNPAYVKPLFPKVLAALTDPNHVMSQILSEIIPVGIDSGKFGRCTKKATYSRYATMNSVDGITVISNGWTSSCPQRINFKISRSCKWDSSVRSIGSTYSNGGYIFGNLFMLSVTVTDFSLAFPNIDSDFHTFSFLAREVAFDPTKGSFENFVVNVLTDKINDQGAALMARWTGVKGEMTKLANALAKYK